MTFLSRSVIVLGLAFISSFCQALTIPVSDPNIFFSPYNWFKSGNIFAQSANPGAYFKVGFTGSKIDVLLDVSTFIDNKVDPSQYPLIRYSVDGGPPTTVQLTPATTVLKCARSLGLGDHSLLVQYVSGYVFLDFWSPINVLRISGLTVDEDAKTIAPTGPNAIHKLNALFLGDSITNGDDDVATFSGGITNAVDTQDATLGYPSVVAAGLGAEFGVVAYGGASWDSQAADGHIPGLLNFFDRVDKEHSRLTEGKFSPVPDDIFINMGENSGPTGDDVPNLLTSLRKSSPRNTAIFIIVPFSGRSRESLSSGFTKYRSAAKWDNRTYLLDLGNNPYLKAGGATFYSVDGQHPLASLHGQLGSQLIRAIDVLERPRKTVDEKG